VLMKYFDSVHLFRDMAPIFQGLGMFVGRALYDSRIIDLHFNKVFLKAILGDHVELSLETLKVTEIICAMTEAKQTLTCSSDQLVDPELARTMSKLEKVLAGKQEIDQDSALVRTGASLLCA